jgi:hypothetical protein
MPDFWFGACVIAGTAGAIEPPTELAALAASLEFPKNCWPFIG